MQGFVFDKDGTLTDLQARWSPVFSGMVTRLADGDFELAGRLAVAIDLDLDAGHVIPQGLAAVGNAAEIGLRLTEIMIAAGAPPGELEDRMRMAFREAPGGPVVPLGEVEATMRAMSDRGLRLGVATADGRRNTLRELDQLGIAHLVDELRCGDDEVVKPDPEVLWGICRAWRLDPAVVTFVGDSIQDLRCARAAGTRFVAVGDLGDGVEPDAVISDIGALR